MKWEYDLDVVWLIKQDWSQDFGWLVVYMLSWAGSTSSCVGLFFIFCVMPEFSSKQVSGWGGVLMNSERRSDVESFGSSGHRVLRYLCGNLTKKLVRYHMCGICTYTHSLLLANNSKHTQFLKILFYRPSWTSPFWSSGFMNVIVFQGPQDVRICKATLTETQNYILVFLE